MNEDWGKVSQICWLPPRRQVFAFVGVGALMHMLSNLVKLCLQGVLFCFLERKQCLQSVSQDTSVACTSGADHRAASGTVNFKNGRLGLNASTSNKVLVGLHFLAGLFLRTPQVDRMNISYRAANNLQLLAMSRSVSQ